MFGKNKGQSQEPQEFFLGNLEKAEEWIPKVTEKKESDGNLHQPSSVCPENSSVSRDLTPTRSPKKKAARPLRARRDLPRSATPEKEKEKAPEKAEKPKKKKTSAPRKTISPALFLKALKNKTFVFGKKAVGAIAVLEKKPRLKKEEPKIDPPSPETKSCPIEDPPSLHPKQEAAVRASLDGMYGVYGNSAKKRPRKLTFGDWLRYGVLFVCIFGFLVAGYFVFDKLYDYYRSYLVYSGLQDMVSVKDRFADDYLKKSSPSVASLTPQDILNGKTLNSPQGSQAFSEDQQNLVSKIAQLKKINPDTAGWITIEGTVVNYPVVWSPVKNYYLRRDFYGKNLSGGSIYIDERNSPNIMENRNTVIYGHNMSDGSMFSSIHDFKNPTVFYGATIQIATQDGIFIYKPFSVHESNAYDNYFETNFVSDSDFVDFCEVMAFMSYFQTDYTFDSNSQILTLSTCMDNVNASDDRFAVHAILVQVIR